MDVSKRLLQFLLENQQSVEKTTVSYVARRSSFAWTVVQV